MVGTTGGKARRAGGRTIGWVSFFQPLAGLLLTCWLFLSVPQDIIQRYRQGSPEQFWAEFSENGEHMKFTSIVQKLREMRKSVCHDIEQQAREAYGPEFSTHFTYRRGGKEYVLTRPSAIAKRYQELAGKDAALA
jgi:hypothetical protein